MSRSGVTVAPDCITAYNQLKLNHSLKFIIYKLSDDYKEIVVEKSSESADYETFREALIGSKSAHKGKEGPGPRFAVYDFEYEVNDGGKRNVISFISWSPDSAAVFPKMTYASSKEALRNALPGIGAEIQANTDEDIEYDSVLKTASRGKR